MNSRAPLVLIGGGGHCVSCIDVIEAEARYRITGILDAPNLVGKRVAGYEVVGTDSDIPRLIAEGSSFLVTLGQIKSPLRRKEIYVSLRMSGAQIATVVSPGARVSRTARVDEGTIVMHNALLVAGAMIGENCIVNSRALVEHGARVGSHCHISTGAIVNGEAEVGDGTFVGSGAIIAQGVRIVSDSIIGAGAVVVRSVERKGTWVGNPLRRLGT